MRSSSLARMFLSGLCFCGKRPWNLDGFRTQRASERPVPPRREVRSEGGSRGFTLVEVILVLFIVAVSLAVVVPRIGAGWRNMGDREFLQEFIGTLKRARLRAMSAGEIVAFRIRGSERTFDLVAPPRQPIPENVDIFADHLEEDPWTGDSMILFYPDGSTSASDLEIKFDQQRAFHVSVHPLFGTVRYSKVDGQ